MPIDIKFNESGSGGSYPTITVATPSARTYDSSNLSAVRLPVFTVTGVGSVTVTITTVTGAATFSDGGAFASPLVLSGDVSTVNTKLSAINMTPGPGSVSDVTYRASITDSSGRSASTSNLVVSNSKLEVDGVPASTTITLSGTTGSIRLMVNGVVISDTVNFNTSLSATATALAQSVTSTTSVPNFTATAAGSVITLLAPLGYGSTANGMTVTGTATGDMSVNGSPLAGGVTQVKPKQSTSDAVYDALKQAAPWVGAALASGMVSRWLGKTEISMGVENETEDPDIAVLLDGLMVPVPLGYTPPTLNTDGTWTPAVYPGAWDYTTFRSDEVFTSNPAWLGLEYVRNKRYGCGNRIKMTASQWAQFMKDTWDMAKRCDELIGGKPRHTCNGVITGMTKREALDAIYSTAWSQILFTNNGLRVMQDRPDTVKRIATNANVSDSGFDRDGGSVASTYNVVEVAWHNPQNYYFADYVQVIDYVDLQSSGFDERFTQLVLFGCTDRSEAIRHGAWTIETEKTEPIIYSYTAGLDHADLIPGDLVAVVNRDVVLPSDVERGGRIVKQNSSVSYELDREISVAQGYLHVTQADGTVAVRRVSSFVNSNGKSTVTLESSFAQTPHAYAVWIYTPSSDLDRYSFKVLAHAERAPGVFDITVVKHDALKYNRIDGY